MEITTFLRETYRNLPRPNRPIGSRFLEPRVSQMWGISGSEARPPTRNTGMVQPDHGQSLLSAAGSSGPALSTVGRRWSMAAQSVANQPATAVQTSANTLTANSQQATTPASTHQQSTVMSPSDSSVTPPSTALLIRGNSTTTVTTVNATAGETRRISFVIQDDAESLTSSQTTLAVQVSIILYYYKD